MTAERPFAAVPGPDAERVSAIRLGLDPNVPDAFEGFGEEARAALAQACAGVARDEGGALADQAARCLEDIRGEARALDPRALTPRRGLAGLFDSRGRRLKRVREAFERADRRLADLGGALTEQVNALKARVTGLEPAHEGLRGPIVELGAWLEAGRQRLADALDEAPEGEVSPRARLASRLEGLAASRMTALGHLPLGRALQNADAVAADRLEAAGRAIQTWRDDWRKALGLEGRRRRKVQPEPSALSALTDRLDAALAGAQTLLADGRARRTRAAERLAELSSSLAPPSPPSAG